MNARERLIRLLEASAGQPPRTPAERARALLSELEIRVANMAGTGDEVLAIPRLLDEVETLLRDLEAGGVDVKPERTRLASIHGMLEQRAAIFVREAGKGLAALRAQVQPPREHWWWYLDEIVAARRRRRLVRLLAGGAAVVLLLVLLGWFIQSRLPQDPRLRRIIDLEQNLDTALAEGRLTEAASVLEELRTLDPENPEYVVTLAAVYEVLDRPDKAAGLWTEAEQRLPPDRLAVRRAQAYLDVGLVDRALDAARQAVDLAPEDPEAFYYLGSAYEAKGDIPAALQAYEKASRLAEAQDRVELLAVIRVRMAYLMQRVPLPTPEVTQEKGP